MPEPNDNVVHFGSPRRPLSSAASLTHGEPPSDDGGMEERLRKVEDAITRIDATMGHLSTKADLAEMKSELVKWVVGTAIALGSAAIVVMTFVLNHAAPKTPAQAPLPIVIQVQPPAAASSPPASDAK